MLKRHLTLQLALIALLLATGLFLQSCSKSNSADLIAPPFAANDNIIAKKLHLYSSEPAGMTGDQHVFGLWSLEASEDDIVAATSNARVSRKLYWLSGQSNQLDQALEFFRAYEQYKTLISTNADILADQNIRYAFVELSTSKSDGKIQYARMWVCSPKTQKIMFLSGH